MSVRFGKVCVLFVLDTLSTVVLHIDSHQEYCGPKILFNFEKWFQFQSVVLTGWCVQVTPGGRLAWQLVLCQWLHAVGFNAGGMFQAGRII